MFNEIIEKVAKISNAKKNALLRKMFVAKNRKDKYTKAYNVAKNNVCALLLHDNEENEIVDTKDFVLTKSTRVSHNYSVNKLNMHCDDNNLNIDDFTVITVDVDKVKNAIKNGVLPTNILESIDEGNPSIALKIEKKENV